MTSEETDSMLAGREMDALVGEKIMGDIGIRSGIPNGFFDLERLMPKYVGKKLETLHDIKDSYYVHENGYAYAYGIVPHYSTDIREAWEVVEKVRSIGAMEVYVSNQGLGWSCMFTAPDRKDAYSEDGDSVSLIICRAALKAMQ